MLADIRGVRGISPTQKYSPKQFGWLTGYIEGEGSFSFHKEYGTVSCFATSTDEESLRHCQAIVGGGINGPHIDDKHLNWKPKWRWNLTGIRAAGLLMTIFSEMTPRRQRQIRTVLEQWKKRKGNPAFRIVCKRGHTFSKENTSIKIGRNAAKERRCKTCHREAQIKYSRKQEN